MSKSRIGNHAGMSPHSMKTGSGISHRGTHLGHITFAGKAGEVKRVDCTEYYKVAPTLVIYTQVTIGSVKVSLTLADVDLALAPDQDAGNHWVEDHVATPGSINACATPAVAMKLEFLEDSVLYLVGC